jgi:phosphodiesterase/alkaline phosphatase D-like protein
MADISRRTFLQVAAAIAAAACGGTMENEANGDADGEAPLDPTRTGDAGALHDGATGPDGEPPPEPPPTPVPGVDLDAIPLRAKDFPYGVMAGDATPTKAMLWTQFIGTAGDLFVQIEEVGGPKGIAVISRAVTASERADGGFVHIDAAGLTAGKRYRYAFFVMVAQAPVARGAFGFVRAALAPNALEVVTFAGTSCTHQMSAPYPLMADAATRKVDFFIHGGDHVYCDNGTNAVTLADYREKYGVAWGTSGMSALHGSTGMVLTWDDHEILNDWNPETLPLSRVATARRAFFEHRATRRDPAAPDRIWRNLVWGNTLEIIVLDARSERKPSTRTAANAQFISPAQMAWLKDRLSKSTAVFKFIVTSVPITNFPPAAAGASDKWEGYPAQREEILDFVATGNIKGVWWLSGDLHFGSIGGIGATGARRQMHEVLMGPGGTTARSPDLSPAQWDKVIDEKNYTVFKADPIKRELTVEFIGAAGSIFKRTYAA